MKRFTLRALTCALLMSANTWLPAAENQFFFKDGDRVVFLGDSITEQRLYTTYIEAYVLTRHPEWNLSFRNVGWGGDTAWLRQRSHPNEGELFAASPEAQQKIVESAVQQGLARDVLPFKPTAVTIKFGMNDHAYQPFREDIFRAYVRSQTELGKVLKAKGARAAFLTPQPIEEKRADPDKDVRNESLRKFSDGLKDVAEKTGALYVDQFAPYLGLMMKARSEDPSAFIGGGDAVHPGPAGHMLMAWAVLKGLGAASSVSAAAVDASAAKVTKAEACKVTALQATAGGVAFDRLDAALPWPIDPKGEPALKLAPLLEDLSAYQLQLTGLKPGQYVLKIDGEKVLENSAEAFAKGFNLTMTGGAVTAQARRVLDLVFQKNNIFFNRWRQVQIYGAPAWAQGPELEAKRQAEVSRLDAQIADMEKQIDAARKPKTHRFEIVPAS